MSETVTVPRETITTVPATSIPWKLLGIGVAAALGFLLLAAVAGGILVYRFLPGRDPSPAPPIPAPHPTPDAPIVLDVPSSAEIGKLVRIRATSLSSVVWLRPPIDAVDQEEGRETKNGDLFTSSLAWTATQGGKYPVGAVTVDAKGNVFQAWRLVDLGRGPLPPPVPPKPPTPNPDPPTPPAPPKPSEPSPFAEAGLRMLIVYETAEAPKMPPAQQGILYGSAIRQFLNDKTPTGPDGKTHEWRIFDKDVDLTGEAKTWQDAMKRPRTALPWLIVGNGREGWEGPLPANVDDAMAILKKYGS